MTDQLNTNWLPDQAIVFDDKAEITPLAVTEPASVSQSGQLGTVLELLVDQLTTVINNLNSVIKLLNQEQLAQQEQSVTRSLDLAKNEMIDQVIDGFFNGQAMTANDGQSYLVPVNYASKSKLVEGDRLQLTINQQGRFLYKQTGPVDRQQLTATLAQVDGYYFAVKDHQRWRLLTVSVEYFRAQPGDQVVIIVPLDQSAQFAALDKLITK